MSIYIPGRSYMVPTIRGKVFGYNETFVIRGHLHDDSEVIGLGVDHYHLDFRFITDEWLDRFAQLDSMCDGEARSYATILCVDEHFIAGQRPKLRRRKCRRPDGEFPRHRAWQQWGKALQAEYAGERLRGPNCRTCPHRGYELAPGQTICPLHGLMFSESGIALEPSQSVPQEIGGAS